MSDAKCCQVLSSAQSPVVLCLCVGHRSLLSEKCADYLKLLFSICQLQSLCPPHTHMDPFARGSYKACKAHSVSSMC
jgi:hypothetical protein